MDKYVISEQGQQCLQQLMKIWFDFERQVGRVFDYLKIRKRAV